MPSILCAITTRSDLPKRLARGLGLLLLCLYAPLSLGQSVLINHGVDGSWFNPASPGQGLFIETVPADNLIWGGWYTFDVSGSAREWYTIWGDISGDRAELTIFESSNAAFDQPGAADLIAVGSGLLRFLSCTQAALDYAIPTQGLSGNIPLHRLTPDLNCASEQVRAHSTMVSADNSWLDVSGDWTFSECIDLGPDESHGTEVFSFDGDQLRFFINRYQANRCQGPVSVQHFEFRMQRVDKTLADLGAQRVIANRVLLTAPDGSVVKQIFALIPIDGQLRLTHGMFDGTRDSQGFPNQLFEVYAVPSSNES